MIFTKIRILRELLLLTIFNLITIVLYSDLKILLTRNIFIESRSRLKKKMSQKKLRITTLLNLLEWKLKWQNKTLPSIVKVKRVEAHLNFMNFLWFSQLVVIRL
jgi:hypothetical protein